MAPSRSLTPLILSGFFAVIILTLIAASAWSHEKATQAVTDNNTDTYYAPADENLPVTDAVIEKTAA
jgi:hypothetical protein